MKHSLKKKKFLYILLVPYLLVGIIATIYFGYKYKTSIREVRLQYSQENQAVLTRVNKEVEYLISDIENLILEIELSERFARLLSIPEQGRTGEENYEIAMALNELKNIKKFNYLIEDVILYYGKGNFFLSPLSIRTELGIYQDYTENQNISFEQWEGRLTRLFPQGSLLTLGNALYYVVSVPFNEEIEYSNIIIKINSTGFDDLLNNYNMVNESAIFLFDQNENQITANAIGRNLQSDGEKGNDSWSMTREISSGKGEISINGDGYARAGLESQHTGLSFVMLTNQQPLNMQIKYMKLMYLSGVVIFGILLFAGLYGAALIYRNIQAIIKRLTETQEKAGENACSEFDFINRALNALEEKMHSQEGAVLDNCIRKAIYGMIEEEDISYMRLRKSHEILCNGQSIIAIFEQREEKERDVKGVKLDLFIIGNVLRDIFQETVECWVIPIQSWEMVTLTWRGEGAMDPEYILAGLDKSRQFLKDYLDLAYTVGVSTPAEGLKAFGTAYGEAMTALEEKQVLGEEEVITYNQKRDTPGSYEFTETMETQLQNYIRLGNQAKAFECIEDIYHQAFGVRMVSPEAGKLLLLHLIRSLNETASELHHPIRIDGTLVLQKRYTAYGIKASILDAVGRMCGQQMEQVDSAQNRQVQIRQYIQKHYMDANLNVNMIADAFHLNSSYLSRFFKEETGENLLNYINIYRIQQVKQLLAETDDTVSTIAASTGFLNAAALNRTFKKYEGITPGQYKSISQATRKEDL